MNAQTSLAIIHGRRGVPNLVTVRQTDLDDLRDEVVALAGEGSELAARIVVLARQAQQRLVRQISPADLLEEIERLALRHGIQATAAAAAMRAEVCPDGADERHTGHGRAA